MTKRDDISSTEKLLETIRNKANQTEIKEEGITINPVSYENANEASSSIKQVEKNTLKQSNHAISSGASVVPSKRAVKTTPVIGKKGAKASLVVGVNIGLDEVRMVMINRISANNRELIKYKSIPFPDGQTKDSKEFPSFLKSCLTAFCGSYANCEIWTAVPTDSLENRFFTIPKVSEKKIANAVYWTFRKEVPFDENDMIFDFEILEEIISDNSKKVVVSAHVINKETVRGIKKLFTDIKFPLTGVSVAPFAFQNFFRLKWVEPETEKICTVNIGLEHSRIDIFADGNLVMSRNVKTGIDSMIASIREESEDGGMELLEDTQQEGDVDLTPVIEVEEFGQLQMENSEENIPTAEPSITLETSDSVLKEIIKNDYHGARKAFLKIAHKKEALALTPAEEEADDIIFKLINPVVERLIRQIERTFEYYSRTYKTSSPDKIIFSGEVSTYKRLTEYIGNQLGLSTGLVDPFLSGIQLTQTVAPPKIMYERESFSVAYGLALSDMSLTPNLIYTYSQKEILKKVKKLNVSLVAAFVVALLVCCGVMLSLNQLKLKKEKEIKEINTELSKFVPRVDQKMLQELFIKLEQKKSLMKKYAVNCIGTAVISEIISKTPDTIKLIQLDVSLQTPKDEDNKSGDKKKRSDTRKSHKPSLLIIEGYVEDKPIAVESTLAGYLVDIGSSPIFGKVTITKKANMVIEEEIVLSFTATVEMI